MTFSLSKLHSAQGKTAVWIIIIFVVICVIFAVLLSKFVTGDVAYAKEYITAIQNYSAEAMIVKSVGDDIVAGRSNQSLSVVKERVQKVQDSLSALKVPKELEDYKNSVHAWADEMNKAVSLQTLSLQKESWKNIPAAPKDASVKLNKNQAKQSLQAGIQHLAAANQFGNYAIATNNTEAMRYVGARLFSQGYWFKVLYQAYRGDICVDGGCLNIVWGEVPILQSAAFSVVAGEPEGENNWEKGWEGTKNGIKPQGISITGKGITEGKSAKPELPSLVQLYADICKSGGGLLDDSGGVKEGIPTSEGGWTCWEPKKQCWHYLAYSGWLFLSGGPQPQACPKMDLSGFAIEGQILGGEGSLTDITKQEEVEDSTDGKSSQISWDGVYQISYGPCSCSAGDCESDPPDTITLRSNKVVSNNNWPNIISSTVSDNADKSVVVYDTSNEFSKGTFTSTYTFSRGSGDEVTVSTVWNSQTTGK